MYMFNFYLETHKGIFDRSEFKVTRDISPTMSGRLLVREGN